MKKTPILSGIPLIWLILALAGACNGEQPTADQWPISKEALQAAPTTPGEGTYRRYCVSCHGADGRAHGGVTGADFVGAAAVLAAKSDAELASAVRDGKVGEKATMPAHKPVLSDEEIHEVVAYVRARFLQPQASDATAPEE
jgi:mono/diheme cytochrome c family protein